MSDAGKRSIRARPRGWVYPALAAMALIALATGAALLRGGRAAETAAAARAEVSSAATAATVATAAVSEPTSVHFKSRFHDFPSWGYSTKRPGKVIRPLNVSDADLARFGPVRKTGGASHCVDSYYARTGEASVSVHIYNSALDAHENMLFELIDEPFQMEMADDGAAGVPGDVAFYRGDASASGARGGIEGATAIWFIRNNVLVHVAGNSLRLGEIASTVDAGLVAFIRDDPSATLFPDDAARRKACEMFVPMEFDYNSDALSKHWKTPVAKRGKKVETLTLSVSDFRSLGLEVKVNEEDFILSHGRGIPWRGNRQAPAAGGGIRVETLSPPMSDSQSYGKGGRVKIVIFDTVDEAQREILRTGGSGVLLDPAGRKGFFEKLGSAVKARSLSAMEDGGRFKVGDLTYYNAAFRGKTGTGSTDTIHFSRNNVNVMVQFIDFDVLPIARLIDRKICDALVDEKD